jgi:hypothetical protein
MLDWWQGLSAVNQCFYIAAGFCSVFILWQLVAALVGLGAAADDVTSHVDVGADHGVGDHVADTDAHETIVTLKLLSFRSILAFFTLFCWAASLYLNYGLLLSHALLLALLWGLGAMLIVSLLLHWMVKLAETGNPQLSTCVGAEGTVYLDIPAGGLGEVRVTVSGVSAHVRARVAGPGAIKAGATIRVLRTIGPNTVEVEPCESPKSKEA